MCGIAGIVGRIETGDSVRLEQMIHSLRRRGPDATGQMRWPKALLGHRRLAIYDLSRLGRQPMVSPDRSIGVVFNGAIYNFRHLRRDLDARGYEFASNTDTEVLVHGYHAWGIDGLVQRLRGMFAFGLWDQTTETLWLVRDRLGVKPLAYAVGDGQLVFASTVEALRASGMGGDLNPDAIEYFLTFGFVPEDRAVVSGVEKLPPATILKYQHGKTKTRAYWRLPAHSEAKISFGDAKERFWELFMEAVELRLTADVPVAGLLSGGIDSALVCRAAVEAGADLQTLTVATPGTAVDEERPATETAEALGVSHHVIEIGKDELDILDDLTTAYSEPFGAGSALGMLAVSRAARKSAKVLITGDGGDDCFLGYPRHRYLFWTQRLAQFVPRFAAPAWRALRPNLPGGFGRMLRPIDYAVGGLPAFLQAKPRIDELVSNGGEIRGPLLARSRLEETDWEWDVERGRCALEEYLDYDRSHQFVSEYLVKVDRATMHHGIEARSPFLDQAVWEFAYGLPPSTHLKGNRLKAILRSLVEDKIGAETAHRRKRGFIIPVQEWLLSRWRGEAEEAFGDGSLLIEHGIFQKEGLRSAWSSASRSEPRALQMWYAFVLERWLRSQFAARR